MEKRRVIELFGEFKAGDEQAFDKFYSLLYSSQFYLAMQILHDEYAAEDVLQETFLQIYRKKDDLKEEQAILVWINRITYHNCVDYIQRNHAAGGGSASELLDNYEEELIDKRVETDPILYTQRGELHRKIMSELARLSNSHRVVIILKYFENMKEKEIAEILDCPIGTVKSRLSAAKKILSGRMVGLYSIAPFFLVRLVSWGAVGTVHTTSLAGTSEAVKGNAVFGAAAGITAVGAAVLVVGQAPGFTSVTLADPAPYVRQQMVSLGVEASGKELNLTLDGGNHAELSFDGREAVVTVIENGSYLVRAVDVYGREAEITIVIDNIDLDIPTCAVSSVEENRVWLQFMDQKAGVDWNTLEAVDRYGNEVIPISLDLDRGMVEFDCGQMPEKVCLADLAGNRAEVELEVAEVEYKEN